MPDHCLPKGVLLRFQAGLHVGRDQSVEEADSPDEGTLWSEPAG